MALHPTFPSKERILLVGAWGAGKSYAWIKLAQSLEATRSTAKLYVLFTDFSMDRSLEGWSHPNVEAIEVADWRELAAASKKFKQMAKKDDWLVVDLISPPWTWAQDIWAEKLADGKTMSEWALEVGGNMEKIAGAYGSNWGHINKTYNDWKNQYVLRFPGHVLACTRPNELRKDRQGKVIGETDDKIIEIFGRWGMKPEGQKHLPYDFHTVLYLQEANPGDYRVSTIRERTIEGALYRDTIKNDSLKDFVSDYLVKVGKWKIL